MSWVELLLSGTFGAVLATAFGSWFSFWAERMRVKSQVILRVVGWSDEVYVRLIDLQLSKHATYTEQKRHLSPEEYDANTRALRSLLIQSAVEAELAIAYGEGTELRLFQELRASLWTATRKLWRATAETWSSAGPEILEYINTTIDPLRERLEQSMVRSASIPILWQGLKERPAKAVRETWRTVVGPDEDRDAT